MNRKILMLLPLLLLSIGVLFGQTINVKGIVVDEHDSPVIGASIRLKNDASVGTTTNLDGEFTIKAKQGEILLVSYVGYKTYEVAAAPSLQIKLKADSELLDEVIVVGYGTATKESLTGAVSVVDAKQLEKRITTSATGALEGSVTGVQVNNTYGEPGAAPKIRIRGIGTLGSQSPLYVLDGVPFLGNISEINPQDIASMSILKDAASTALYGSRAANGVVLITTKSGRGAAPSVNVSINQGVYVRGLPEYDRLRPNDWMEVSWQAMKNGKKSAQKNPLNDAAAAEYATKNLVAEYIKRNIYDKPADQLFDKDGNLVANILPGYDDLDWAENIERTGWRQEYNVSGNFANDKLNIFASAGYLDEKGYIVSTGYKRFSARSNVAFNPVEWLSTGLNINAVHTDRSFNDNAKEKRYKNPFNLIRNMAPVYPVFQHNEDGSYKLDANGQKIYDFVSPYLNNRHIGFELREDVENTKRNVLGMQTFGTFKLPYGFSFTLRGDLNKSTSNYLKYDNVKIGDGAGKGRLQERSIQYTNYTFQKLLNWNYTFNDLHTVEFLLGHENYAYHLHEIVGQNTGIAVDGVKIMSNFLENTSFNGSETDYRTESYLSRLKYNFANRYILEGSFRRDGSSRFHPDRRWGNFFSAGASWNISNEAFMKDVKWVDFLKLRASYGEVGNDQTVDYYGYMALYDITKNGGKPAFVKNSLDASDIRWETTQTVDIGIEGRLFDRLDFNLGYFDKRSIDLLFKVPLALSSGSAPYNDAVNQTINKNIGTISNSGIELSLNYDIFNTRDFSWSIGTEGTFLKNRVVKLPGGEDILKGTQRISEGHSVYEYYTYNFVGVDQLTGRALYTLDPKEKEKAKKAKQLVTINGVDYTYQDSYALRDWSGSALPDYYGSFNTNIQWKGVRLYALFTYSLGGKLYDSAYRSLMSTASATDASANHVDLLKSWKQPPVSMTENDPNRINPNGIPIIDFTNSAYNNGMSNRWLVDASYFVFKNLNLSYSLPQHWVESMSLSDMTLTLGAENLFTLTSRKGVNPQQSFSGSQDATYVTARVFNFGLSFKF